MELAAYLPAGGLLLVVAAVGYWGWRRERRRRGAFAGFAASKGWTYTARDDHWCTRWRGAPFERGVARRARNVLVGDVGGRPMVAFDYSFRTDSHDGHGNTVSRTHHYAVCALALPCPLPPLRVTPENPLTRLGNAVGLGDLTFESEEFNRAFRVSCPDPRFASDLLHPRTMELLLRHRPFNFRLAGADILCWEDGRYSLPQLLERTATLAAVVDGVPSFVWRDRGVRDATSQGAS